MPALDRIVENTSLFGGDPLPGIVAVERTGPQEVTLYLRDRDPSGGIGALRKETAEFKPWILIDDPVRLTGFAGKVEVEPLEGGGAYRHRVSVESWPDLLALGRFLKTETGVSAGSPNGPYLLLQDDACQYLMATGRTLFNGMHIGQVHRLQLDLETYCAPGFEFPNPERSSDRIIAISLCDNTGWECCLSGVEMDEPTLLREFIRIVQERDPDVLEGHNLFKFDLPYLEARARQYRIPLALGRDGSRLSGHPSRFTVAERLVSYQKYACFGRHIVDTMFLALLYDVSFRNLESFGLKDIARHFGFASENRTYLEGNRISWTFDHDPETLFRYALDDVRETRQIGEMLGHSYFIQSQMFPLSFQNVVVRGNATKIDLLFLREYIHRRQAVPHCPAGRTFEGGLTDLKLQGVYDQVLHCDVRSLYPSVMLAFGHVPRSDELGVFRSLLQDLRQFRLEARKEAKEAVDQSQKDHAEALQSTFKVLINSFYGYLGFTMGHFADFTAAARVTSKGRELLRHMLTWLETQGARVIEVDTDGIYFLAPPAGDPECHPDRLIERLNETLPEGIEAELDGRYAAMFSYKVKNYVLLEEDGRLVVKGSGLKSRAVELFQRRFMEEIFHHLLHRSASALGGRLRQYEADLAAHRWEPAMFIKRESLQDSLALYQQKVKQKKRATSAAYELAIASGRPYQPGDQISFYVTGTSTRVKVFEAARLADQWRPEAPDENVAYYRAKLHEVYRKFEPFIVAAGGTPLAELVSGQLSLGVGGETASGEEPEEDSEDAGDVGAPV